MKKMYLIFILSLLILTGCTNSISEEDTQKYQDLSNQYTSFVQNDIALEPSFQEFINQATLISELSNIMIKVQYYDDMNNLIETKYGSGVVFKSATTFEYALTSSDLLKMPDGVYQARYVVYDYQGRITAGYLDLELEDYQLSVIRFLKDSHYSLPGIKIGSTIPMFGEPILLLGYQHQIINAMSLGLMQKETIPDDFNNVYFNSSVPSDVYANGGAILNINNELIGIQIATQNNYSFAVAISSILHTLDVFYQQHIFQ